LQTTRRRLRRDSLAIFLAKAQRTLRRKGGRKGKKEEERERDVV